MQIRPYQETDRPFLRTLYRRRARRRSAGAIPQTISWNISTARRWAKRFWWRKTAACCWDSSPSTAKTTSFITCMSIPISRARVGSALLQAAEATFTATGSLKCLVKNEKALAFYRKHGWRIISTGNDGEEDYYLLHSPAR